MKQNYIGNLYTVVCDFLWNGSTAVPKITGLKALGISPNNYVRWDNPIAEARFTKKDQVQPGDLPEVEITPGRILTKLKDSCSIQHDINFAIRITTGKWNVIHATRIIQQVMSLLVVAQHTAECCLWDIAPEEDPKSTVVETIQTGEGNIDRDKDINRNQSGWTYEIKFAVRILTNVYLQQ